MRLLIVRHADPDYSIDSPTPAGWEESKLLADRLRRFRWRLIMYRRWDVRRTRRPLDLKKACRTAETCSWLREFAPQAVHPGKGFRALCLGLAAGCVDGGTEVFLIRITGMKQKSFRTPM